MASIGAAVVFVGVACAAGAQHPRPKADAAPLTRTAAVAAAASQPPEPGHAPEDWVETVALPPQQPEPEADGPAATTKSTLTKSTPTVEDGDHVDAV